MFIGIMAMPMGCNGPLNKGPSWNLVESKLQNVISPWYINVLSGTNVDDCDIGIAAVANKFAVDMYFNTIGEFILTEVTVKTITTIINAAYPITWPMELLRDQVIGWTYKTMVDYLNNRAEFHWYSIECKISEMGRGGRNLLNHLPSDVEFKDYIMVGYNQDIRRVSLLIVGDCRDNNLSTKGNQLRAWEVNYTVDDNGMPVGGNQELKPIDLDTIELPPELIEAKDSTDILPEESSLPSTSSSINQVADDIPGTNLSFGISQRLVVDKGTKPRDVYALSLSAGEEVLIKVTGHPGQLNFILAAPGSTSFDNNRYTSLYNSMGQYTTSPWSYAFTPATSGTYYFAVNAWENHSQPYSVEVNETR
jgi:hypothetical protein